MVKYIMEQIIYTKDFTVPFSKQEEQNRLNALYAYNILDSEPETEFDSITRLASYICGTEISLITLLDEQRQWFKSKVGVEVNETPRETSFCHFAIQSDLILEVEDTQTHPLFRDNPFVVNDPHIRFYAGAPLITPTGQRLGTLCVVDKEPKVLTPEQRNALEVLAKEVIFHLEMRRQKKMIEHDNSRLQLYRLLFNHSSELMCILDTVSGTFIEVNVAFQHVMGYSQPELLGKSFIHFIYPADLPVVTALLNNQLARECHNLEARFYRKDGTLRWISWTASGLGGKLFATARDITDLKKSGSENIDLKSFLVNVLDNSPSGICAFESIRNSQGEIIDFTWVVLNQYVEKLIGIKAPQLVGSRLLETLPLENRADILEIFTRVVESNAPLHEEYKFANLDNPLWVQLTASRLEDGLLVLVHDISARKNIKQQLQQQKDFYESILDNLPSDIVVFDASHRYLFTNPQAIKNPEMRQWIIGKDDFEYCAYRGKDTTLARNRRVAFLKAIEDKQIQEWEDEIISPAGEVSQILRRLCPVYNPEDKLQFVIGYGFNITDLNKAQQELITAKEQAEQSMRAKEMFLSMMSHEIRTPLNAVIGMSHLLLQEDPKPEQIENLKILQFSGENLLTLINDILDFSKIEAGKINFEEVDFSFKDLISGIRQTFSHRAAEKGIRLHTRLDVALPDLLVGDPVRLNQILMNLISNAIKFTDKGSVTLDITAEQEDAHTLEISFVVTDTGIGIPADKQQYIFESFTQANSDTTRKFGGTGLGLTITKKLIQMQEGTIDLQSEVGRGSIFKVNLKLKKSTKPSIATTHHYLDSTANNLGHIQLLLVEDNEVNQLIATKFLKKWGIKPLYAVNGLEAIYKAKQNKPDLVLMDLQMPEMDGYEASKAIRELGGYFATMPIIALTASAMLDVRDKVFEYGMNDYVTKPFNPNELYQKITRHTQLNSHQVAPAIAEKEAYPAENSNFAFPAQRLCSLKMIEELAGSDAAFRSEMIKTYISSLKEFASDYQLYLLETPDLSKFQFISHRIKAVLKIIEANTLINEIEEAGKLLQLETTRPERAASVQRVKQTCNALLQELEKNKAGYMLSDS